MTFSYFWLSDHNTSFPLLWRGWSAVITVYSWPNDLGISTNLPTTVVIDSYESGFVWRIEKIRTFFSLSHPGCWTLSNQGWYHLCPSYGRRAKQNLLRTCQFMHFVQPIFRLKFTVLVERFVSHVVFKNITLDPITPSGTHNMRFCGFVACKSKKYGNT